MKGRFVLLVLAAIGFGIVSGCSKPADDSKVDLKAGGTENKPDPGTKAQTAP